MNFFAESWTGKWTCVRRAAGREADFCHVETGVKKQQQAPRMNRKKDKGFESPRPFKL